MKKLIIGIILFLSIPNLTSAELIDGPANIREKPKGKVIFSLNDNVQVDCIGLAANGWCKISISAYIKSDSFLEDITKEKHTFDGKGNTYLPEIKLKPGAKLYDSNKKIIGNVLSEGTVSGWYYPPKDDPENYLLACDLFAYTYQDNIRPESTIESLLVDAILKAKNNPVSYPELRNYIENNNYRQWIQKGDFNSFLRSEDSEGLFSRGIRLVMIFYNDVLVAVMYADRPINLEFIDVSKGKGSIKIGYLEKLDPKVKQELEELFFGVKYN